MGIVKDAAIVGTPKALAQTGQVDEVGLHGERQLVKVAFLRFVIPTGTGKVIVRNGIDKDDVLVSIDPTVAVEVGLVERSVAFLVDFQQGGHGDGRF